MKRDERRATATDAAIGKRIRARRLAIAMTQERLAELLGLTFQQVQKYEKGVNRVAASRLFDIAAALNAPLDYFFEGVTSPVTRRAKRGKEAA
ncbi:helix-turn-helix domain-containing protein [Terricaulis silvestris]|nr:helix-turn-helix transcriptional regulator [Terricaulis silvestris]